MAFVPMIDMVSHKWSNSRTIGIAVLAGQNFSPPSLLGKFRNIYALLFVNFEPIQYLLCVLYYVIIYIYFIINERGGRTYSPSHISNIRASKNPA